MPHRVLVADTSLHQLFRGDCANLLKKTTKEKQQAEEIFLGQETQGTDIRPVEMCALVWWVQIWDLWFHPPCLCAKQTPKHTSRLCNSYLTKRENDGVLRQMTWPPQSPDLNPTEMVWDEMDCRGKAKVLSISADSFKTAGKPFQVTTSWSSLRDSQRVCKAVIKAKGGYFEESQIYIHVLSYFTHFCSLHNSIWVHS